jgi:hypothetical protein
MIYLEKNTSWRLVAVGVGARNPHPELLLFAS